MDKISVAFMDKSSGHLVQKTLKDGLGISGGEKDYVIFHDINSGLEYIRSSKELAEKGLYVELGAYKCHAFMDFREIYDADGKIRAVCVALNGAGVPSIDAKKNEMFAPEVVEPKAESIIGKPKKKAVNKPAPVKKATKKTVKSTGTKKADSKKAPVAKKTARLVKAKSAAKPKKVTVKKTSKPTIKPRTKKPVVTKKTTTKKTK